MIGFRRLLIILILYFQKYNSNYYRWSNNLKKESYLIIFGEYRFKKIRAGAKFQTLGNYTYFNDSIKPLLFKNDIVDPHDQRGKEEKEGEKKDSDENSEPMENDDILFSIEAISVMLNQEDPEGLKKILPKIDLLRQKGITSIPIKQEQSILLAITEAASFLEEK